MTRLVFTAAAIVWLIAPANAQTFANYNCNDGEGPKDQVARPPVCDDGILVVHVRFPQCWDGVHLDSPNHISHMAWTDEGDTCPASHPVAIPRVTIRAEYPVGQGYAPRPSFRRNSGVGRKARVKPAEPNRSHDTGF